MKASQFRISYGKTVRRGRLTKTNQPVNLNGVNGEGGDVVQDRCQILHEAVDGGRQVARVVLYVQEVVGVQGGRHGCRWPCVVRLLRSSRNDLLKFGLGICTAQ